MTSTSDLRPPSPAPPPDFLTVEEAADVLRIGRTAAYQLTRRYLETAGADGIPATRIGRQLRVPRCRLEELLGGPLTWPASPRDTSERGLPLGEHEPPPAIGSPPVVTSGPLSG